MTTLGKILFYFVSIFLLRPLTSSLCRVRIPWPLWIEWMVSIPVLIMIVVAFDTKVTLSTDDITAILNSELMIISGLFIRINSSTLPGIFPTIFFLIFCYCCQTPFQLLLKTYSELKSLQSPVNDPLDSSLPSSFPQLAQTLSLTSRRYNLCCLLSISFPLFLLIYLLRATHLISHEQCLLIFLTTNLLSKMIFFEIAFIAYLQEFHSSNRQLHSLLQSDLHRITYLKFVFHEARIPLQSISLGLNILQNWNNSQTHQSLPSSHSHSTPGLAATSSLSVFPSPSSCPSSCPSSSAEDYQDTIHHIQFSTQSISSIFDHILLLHKINDQKLHLKFKLNNLYLMVRKVVTRSQDIQYELRLKNIDIQIQIDSNVLPEVICDSFYLSTVLSIYLINSLQSITSNSGQISLYIFNSNGEYHPTTTSSSSSPSSPSSFSHNESWRGLCFEVHDTGRKIDPKEMKSIFQPYDEIKLGDVHTHRGTGIGLSLCREIIHLHGGEVYCKSSSETTAAARGGGGESGCIFGFIIPLSLTESSTTQPPLPQRQQDSTTPHPPTSPTLKILFPLEHLQILIVEGLPFLFVPLSHPVPSPFTSLPSLFLLCFE
jgi:signal transduction histidine kinase